MTKRKLKPLWQVLKENPDYYFGELGDLCHENEVILTPQWFCDFGDVCTQVPNNFKNHWFENELPPVPRRKLYAYRVGASAIRFHTKEHSEHSRAPEYDLEV